MKAAKIAIVILVVIVATAGVAMFVGVPVGFLTGPIKAQVESATGYRLEIGGGSRLALWPALKVVVHDVTLSDPTGAKSPDMVSAESVQGTVSLSSLFGGHPRVSELVITRPT